MILHKTIEPISLRKKIRRGEIVFGGNRVLKIYGTLSCKSGKRMKKENRVFFSVERDALQNGYRPCGHCLKQAYLKWKQSHKKQSPVIKDGTY